MHTLWGEYADALSDITHLTSMFNNVLPIADARDEFLGPLLETGVQQPEPALAAADAEPASASAAEEMDHDALPSSMNAEGEFFGPYYKGAGNVELCLWIRVRTKTASLKWRC